jgi:hypothetical protein
VEALVRRMQVLKMKVLMNLNYLLLQEVEVVGLLVPTWALVGHPSARFSLERTRVHKSGFSFLRVFRFPGFHGFPQVSGNIAKNQIRTPHRLQDKDIS